MRLSSLFIITAALAWALPQAASAIEKIDHAERALVTQICEARLLPDTDGFRGQRSTLEVQMKNAIHELRKLLVSANEVTATGRYLGVGVVGTVFEVSTPEGPMALKLYLNGSMTHFARAILLQRYLGLYGVAPKVKGVLSRAQLKKLLAAHPALGGRISSRVVKLGLLMEIADGHSVKQVTPASAVENGWSYENVVKQIESIEHLLGNLRIVPDDGQVMISPSGRVLLHDLDFYKWVSDDNRLFSFSDFGGPVGGVPPGVPLKADLLILTKPR